MGTPFPGPAILLSSVPGPKESLFFGGIARSWAHPSAWCGHWCCNSIQTTAHDAMYCSVYYVAYSLQVNASGSHNCDTFSRYLYRIDRWLPSNVTCLRTVNNHHLSRGLTRSFQRTRQGKRKLVRFLLPSFSVHCVSEKRHVCKHCGDLCMTIPLCRTDSSIK